MYVATLFSLILLAVIPIYTHRNRKAHILGMSLATLYGELKSNVSDISLVQNGTTINVTCDQQVFDAGSDRVLPCAEAVLLECGNFLKKHTDVYLFANAYAEDDLENLSQRRADAIKNILISSGVSSHRILAAGIAQTKLPAKNEPECDFKPFELVLYEIKYFTLL